MDHRRTQMDHGHVHDLTHRCARLHAAYMDGKHHPAGVVHTLTGTDLPQDLCWMAGNWIANPSEEARQSIAPYLLDHLQRLRRGDDAMGTILAQIITASPIWEPGLAGQPGGCLPWPDPANTDHPVAAVDAAVAAAILTHEPAQARTIWMQGTDGGAYALGRPAITAALARPDPVAESHRGRLRDALDVMGVITDGWSSRMPDDNLTNLFAQMVFDAHPADMRLPVALHVATMTAAPRAGLAPASMQLAGDIGIAHWAACARRYIIRTVNPTASPEDQEWGVSMMELFMPTDRKRGHYGGRSWWQSIGQRLHQVAPHTLHATALAWIMNEHPDGNEPRCGGTYQWRDQIARDWLAHLG